MSAWSFYLPDLGEGLREAELVSWLVAVGDHVVEDQPLLSVETEKSLVDIPSPVAGRVVALHGAAGQVLPVGTLLAEFDTARRPDAGAIVGTLPDTLPDTQPDTQPGQQPATGSGFDGAGNRVRAAPAVRAEARRRGVDLATLSGTGRDGSISLADLPPPATEPGAAEPLRSLRRSMAASMSKAGQQVVAASVTGYADIEAWPAQEPPLLRLVQAVIAACAQEPALNAWFDARRNQRILHSRVDIGIATDTADGLLVPVLRAAQDKNALELQQRLRELRQASQQRTLAPEQLERPTITLSNFGAIAGETAQMVVLPPQVAIVGAGRIRRVPVAVGEAVQVHARLPISISFDHRVVTGGETARFLSALIAALEQTTSLSKQGVAL